MNNLTKMIHDLNYDDLQLVKKDLEQGNIERLINKRIHHFKEGSGTICPVCHTEINEPDHGITLLFGPKDFRKKASFDATDCLDYFVQKLKSISEKESKTGGEIGTS